MPGRLVLQIQFAHAMWDITVLAPQCVPRVVLVRSKTQQALPSAKRVSLNSSLMSRARPRQIAADVQLENMSLV